jgi:energy-coupling factor transporter transmembrane protein EcfT
MKKLKLRAALTSLKNLIVKHRQLSAIIILLIIALGVNVWRNWDDRQEQAASQTTTVTETEAKPPPRKFHIGWVNLTLLGGCIAAIGYVKYKKSLKTDDEIKESKKDCD